MATHEIRSILIGVMRHPYDIAEIRAALSFAEENSLGMFQVLQNEARVLVERLEHARDKLDKSMEACDPEAIREALLHAAKVKYTNPAKEKAAEEMMREQLLATRKTLAAKAYQLADDDVEENLSEDVKAHHTRTEVSRARYTGVQYINEAIENKSVLLIDGSWLLQWDPRKPIPKRQDVPNAGRFKGFIGPPDHGAAAVNRRFSGGVTQSPHKRPAHGDFDPMGFENAFILVISYCWASRSHPDPNCHQLRKVQNVLRFMTKNVPDIAKGWKKIAIFWDWMSMPQKEKGKPRTEEEQRLFDMGLKNVNLWYCHEWTYKLVLSELPPGCEPRATYDDSGWPTFEYAVSAMISHPLNMWDASLLNARFLRSCHDFKIMRNKAARNRGLPLDPVEMRTLLKKKRFTNSADPEIVSELYAKTFEQVVVCAQKLDYKADSSGKGLKVSARDWQGWFDGVARFFLQRVEEIDLRFNQHLRNVTFPTEFLQILSGGRVLLEGCPGPFGLQVWDDRDEGNGIDYSKVFHYIGNRLAPLPAEVVRLVSEDARVREHRVITALINAPGKHRLDADLSELDGISQIKLSAIGRTLSGSIDAFKTCCSNLVHVNIICCSRITGTLDGLSSATALECLEISQCRNLTGSLDPLTNCKNLKVLTLDGCKKLTGDMGILSKLHKLEELSCVKSNMYGDVVLLAFCNKMRILRMCENPRVRGENLEPLARFSNLEELHIRSCTGLKGSLLPLAEGCKRLNKLNIFGAENVVDDRLFLEAVERQLSSGERDSPCTINRKSRYTAL